ncbi:MAG TPA: hypothetical protein PKJ33_00350 [Alphaproteobacteria bacterium]|nr:hypothetical protein [Alphaproteobacteria bacterium]
MKNKKIVFFGVMSVILIGAGTAQAAPGDTQLTSKGYVDAQNATLSTNTTSALNLKADKTDTYTKTEVDTALGAKADTASLGALATKSTVTTTDIDDASVTKPKLSLDVQTTLGKADTALQSADLTDYAKTADVNTGLATKADTTYVDGQLATKANTTDVTTALATKADTTYVDTGLATKANTTDVNTALATKEDVANKSDNMTTDTGSTSKYTTVHAVESYVGGVVTGINTDLSGKEDVANKSNNIATDTGSTTKYTTVNAVETYSVPKPSANCLGAQAQCVLSINKTTGTVYWEDVAVQ